MKENLIKDVTSRDVAIFEQRAEEVLRYTFANYNVSWSPFVQLRIAKVNLVTGTQDSST